MPEIEDGKNEHPDSKPPEGEPVAVPEPTEEAGTPAVETANPEAQPEQEEAKPEAEQPAAEVPSDQAPEITEPFTKEEIAAMEREFEKNPALKVQYQRVLQILAQGKKRMQGDYTKKTQDVAKRNKEIEAEKQTYIGYKSKAERMAQIESNPQLMQVLEKILKGEGLPAAQQVKAESGVKLSKLDLQKVALAKNPNINPKALEFLGEYNDIFNDAITEMVQSAVGQVRETVEPIAFEREIDALQASVGNEIIIKYGKYREDKARGMLVKDPNGEVYGFEDEIKEIMKRDGVSAKEAFWRIPEVRDYYSKRPSAQRTAAPPTLAPKQPTSKTVVLGGNGSPTQSKKHTPEELEAMTPDQFAKATGLSRTVKPRDLNG